MVVLKSRAIDESAELLMRESSWRRCDSGYVEPIIRVCQITRELMVKLRITLDHIELAAASGSNSREIIAGGNRKRSTGLKLRHRTDAPAPQKFPSQLCLVLEEGKLVN